MCPLRNQFQMLFATELEFEVRSIRSGMEISRDSHRRSILSPRFVPFPSSVEFLKGYSLE